MEENDRNVSSGGDLINAYVQVMDALLTLKKSEDFEIEAERILKAAGIMFDIPLKRII